MRYQSPQDLKNEMKKPSRSVSEMTHNYPPSSASSDKLEDYGEVSFYGKGFKKSKNTQVVEY